MSNLSPDETADTRPQRTWRDKVSRRRVVAGLLPVSVAGWTGAFAQSFGGTLAWHQRDEVTANAIQTSADGDTVEVRVRINNPLTRKLTTTGVRLVVYEGAPPFADNQQLTVPRQAQLVADETVIAPESTAAVTATAPVEDGVQIHPIIDEGTATPSGVVRVILGDKEFDIRVPPTTDPTSNDE